MSHVDPSTAVVASRRAPAARWFWWLLVPIVVLGLLARTWNIDWDQRQHLHPDERHWALTSAALERADAPPAHGTVLGPLLDWLDGDRSPANAYRGSETFVYGPVTLAVARGVSGWLHEGVADDAQPAAVVARTLDALGIPLIDDGGAPTFDDGYQVDLVGRLLGALVDTATILVVALVGRRMGGAVVGLVAGALYASSVLAIQHAHFLGAEPLLGLGCALTLLAALRLHRGANVAASARSGLALGACIGVAMAAKLTAAGLVVVPIAGCAALFAMHRRLGDLARLATVLVGAVVTFRVLHPGAFSGLGLGLSDPFVADVRLARDLSRSTQPPSFQWSKRLPVVQPLAWFVAFTVGPGVCLAALVGAWTTWRDRARRIATAGRWPLAMIAGGIVAPFTYIELTSLPLGRYYVPMLPAVHVAAGVGVVALVRRARVASTRSRRAIAGTVAASTVALAALWALAFVHGVYGHTNTRIEASRWIEQHVPRGSVLSSQAWDDGLPLRLPDLDGEAYVGEQLDMVGPDDVAKVGRVADQLGRIDVVVESSPRIWASVTRMPARFPSTIKFFEGLDDGALGFERVATFTSRPRLGPFELDDSGAEEAFSVYDHPEVRIWAKVRDVPRAELVDYLDPVAASNAVPVDAHRGWANGLLLYDDEIARNAVGPTYDDAFDTSGSSLVHVLGWFVLLELLGLAAFAMFLPLLRRLPDAGLGLSKTLALSATAFAVFVWAAWLDGTITRASVTVITAVFVGLGGWAAWRSRGELRHLWRTRRSLLVTVECVGAALFVLGVVLRAANPDLWHQDRGGEKPFELALLTAVLRTRTFPVYDPWFAGGTLNYHYGGWFLLTAPARLLRTTPSLVMNLGIAAFASCAGTAACSLGAAVFARGRPRGRSRRVPRGAVVAGVLASCTVLLLTSAAIVAPLWRQLSPGVDRTIDWWGLSRVIPRSVAITEFPAWSFLFGDLHPHVMGITVVLCVGACCIALHDALLGRRGRPAYVLAAVVGALVGVVRITNTWDLPLVAVAVVSTFALAVVARAPWRRCAWSAMIVIAVVTVVWAPSTWRGEVYDDGVESSTLRTPFTSWVQHFGFFAVVTIVAIALRARGGLRGAAPVVGRVNQAHLVVVAVALLAFGYAARGPGHTVVAVNAVLVLGAAWAAWRARRTGDGSPLAPGLLALGWAIVVAVELFTVRNDAGRTNTVFKFWYQSWVLLAVGTAVLVAEQAAIARGRARSDARRAWPRRTSRALLAGGAVMTVAFWWLATPVRLDDRISAGGLSLDGEAYLRPDFTVGADADRFVPAGDLPLVEWLRANVRGIRVVAEAPGEDYRWTSRISSMTGLPTPIGWAYHERQQRRPYGPIIDARRADLHELYSTSDPAAIARVLSRYDVAYVVFGTQERLLSPDDAGTALRRFDCLTVRYDGDQLASGLFVASVDPDCLSRWRSSG